MKNVFQPLIWCILGYLLVLSQSSLCSLDSLAVNLNEHCLHGFFEHGGPEPIAVLEIPYLICDASNSIVSLAFDQNTLILNDETSAAHLFTFSRNAALPNDLNNFQLVPWQRLNPIAFNNADNCRVHIIDKIDGKYTIQLVFRTSSREAPMLYLQSDPDGRRVLCGSLKSTFSSRWTLRPAYNLEKNIQSSSTDPETQLLKISRKELVAGGKLTAQQFIALYRLSHEKKMTLHKETADDFLVDFEDMISEKGFFITATNGCPLRVYNVRDYIVGVGVSAVLAKTSAQLFVDSDFVDIDQGKTVHIRSQRNGSTSLGDLEITLGEYGKVWGKSFDDVRIPLRNILNQNFVMLADFVIEVKGDTLIFSKTNRNVLTNPGNAAYVAQIAGQMLIRSAGKEALIVTDRFSRGIEIASFNAREALLGSSKNLADALVISIVSLEDTLTFATKTFENSVRFLGLTARHLSKDMERNARVIVGTIDRASKNLREALKETSENLVDVTEIVGRTITQNIDNARISFDAAFMELSDTFKSLGQNHEKAITGASENFIKAMTEIKSAAGQLAHTKHNVNLCILL